MVVSADTVGAQSRHHTGVGGSDPGRVQRGQVELEYEYRMDMKDRIEGTRCVCRPRIARISLEGAGKRLRPSIVVKPMIAW